MAAVGRIATVATLAFAIAACGSGKDGDEAEGNGDDPATATRGADTAPAAPALPTGPDPVAAMEQPDHTIHRVGDTRWIVDRDVVLQLAVDGIGGWLVTTRVSNGYRVDHTPEGSVARRLGFADGDVVVRVNDIALTGREDVRKAYAAMRESKELMVVVERDGVATTRRYSLYEAVRAYVPSSAALRRKSPPSAAYEAVLLAVRTGVKRVDDQNYELDRAVVQAFAKHPDILRWAGLTSSRRRARRSSTSGVSIAATPSVLQELGLTVFDRVTEVNGEAIEGRAALREALLAQGAELRFTLTVYRLDEPLTLTYKLVDGLVDRPRLDKALAEWEAERVLDPMPDLSRDPDTADNVDPALDDAIRKVADNHYTIERAAVDDLLANPGAHARGARIVPSVKNGNANGFKLYAIRPSSLYAKLGLHNGDTIHSLNGMDVTTPDKALEAYDAVRGAPRVTLEVTRRGKPVTLTYDIK